jgi:hypothetical protein
MNTFELESKMLHIAGLPIETTEEDILNFFKDYKVEQIRLIK